MKWLRFILPLLVLSACKKAQIDSRTFYMAVTPWPYDFNKDGVNQAYNFIHQNCDAVSHHFDDGIPWQEAYDNLPWPSELRKNLDERIAKTPAGKKVLLSVAPLAFSRKEKAGYYRGKNENDKGVDWVAKPFDDTMVATAYARFVSRMAHEFNASFINFGVESNSKDWDTTNFAKYKIFLKRVYSKLKSEFPSLPIFISVMVVPEPGFKTNASALADIGDWTGISCYPYSSIGSTTLGSTDPDLIEKNLLESYIDLANKPWCFAETGYIAQDLYMPQTGISKRGLPEWQYKYLNQIFTLANRRNCQLMVWFCHRDYDAGTRTLKAIGAYLEFFSLWQNTGFEDENGWKRPAFKLWSDWNKTEKK